MKKELTIKKVLLTFIIFLVIWSIRTIFIKQVIDENFELWSREFINGFIKITIWFGFAYYFMKKYNNYLSIKLNQVLKNPIKIKVLILGILIIIIYHILGKLIMSGSITFKKSFYPNQLIGMVLIAGIFEEFLFRGWFYNVLTSFVSDSKAIVISTIMFIFIHYPRYFVEEFSIANLLITSIGVFSAGVLFGYSFKKSKSLWVPIILHMTWNLLSITIGL